MRENTLFKGIYGSETYVIIVTDLCDPKLIEDMHMTHAFSIDEAMKKAQEKVGKDASIVVIPDGVSVIAVD